MSRHELYIGEVAEATDIGVEGNLREADVLAASISSTLGRIAAGDLGAELVAEACFLNSRAFGRNHPPVVAALWESPENKRGTDTPKTRIEQFTDPCERQGWKIESESEILPNGSPTVDIFNIFENRITVQRYAPNGSLSGYYLGVVETGTVYDPRWNVVNVPWLQTLQAALPPIH